MSHFAFCAELLVSFHTACLRFAREPYLQSQPWPRFSCELNLTRPSTTNLSQRPHTRTGASGYIGGEVLHAIATAHPEYTIRALNRDATKSALITAAYPSVTIVPGSLDDSATLEAEAAQADIVLNLAAREHLPSAQAILKGLTSPSRTSSTTAKRPYWIQVSGATLLASPEIARGTYGEPSDKIHDDLSGVAEIIALVRSNPKRATDNFVLDSGHAHGVNTALVPPGIIYGEGAGPVNRRTFQVPELARVAVERGRAVQVGRGLARWGYVHIRDLGQLFLRLVEKAAAGEDGRAGLWGEEGIYFTGVGGDIVSFISLFLPPKSGTVTIILLTRVICSVSQ